MPGGGHKFDAARRAYLDSEERHSYLDAPRILAAFHLSKGSHVADVGAGTGFFAIPAARAVGARGQVYATDLSPKMLGDLERKIAKQGLKNITALRSTEDRIPLSDRCVDFALLACVLHELDGPGTLIECRRILRPNGRLGVVDWKKIDQEFGPPKGHRLDEDEAKTVLRDAGFVPRRTFEAGEYHYGIEARIRRT